MTFLRCHFLAQGTFKADQIPPRGVVGDHQMACFGDQCKKKKKKKKPKKNNLTLRPKTCWRRRRLPKPAEKPASVGSCAGPLSARPFCLGSSEDHGTPKTAPTTESRGEAARITQRPWELIVMIIRVE